MRIFVEFAPGQLARHRCRISYAFRLFCAIYAHKPILERELSENADIWISYAGDRSNRNFPRVLQLSDLYVPRPAHLPAPAPTPYEAEDIPTVLFHVPQANQQPDWLGEIFEWVSCADEY